MPKDLQNERWRHFRSHASSRCTEAFCKLNARWTTSGKKLAIGCLQGKEAGSEKGNFSLYLLNPEPQRMTHA